MGLMLSVLVFCVGVAEVLDCWHHFILYLVQPQFNPLPYPLDPRKDVLCENELYPSPDSRRSSHVDISWPKDLLPTDDLHVIKKRTHSEQERNFDTIGDKSSGPNILVCGTDPEERNQNSPTGPWTSSPDHLELSVITESDSSSEGDEPSMVENLSYNKSCTEKNGISFSQNNVEKHLSDDQSAVINRCNDSKINYDTDVPISSSPKKENDGEVGLQLEEYCCDEPSPAFTESPQLPVFTYNILSSNVQKVSSFNPSIGISLSPLCIEQMYAGNNSSNGKSTDCYGNTPESNYECTNPTEHQSISSVVDEDLEPIPEYPEIRLLESSPTPPELSSESSLNTSDASMIARSKTSDRPLVIRFSPSPHHVHKECETVTNPQLFESNQESKKTSVSDQEDLCKNNDSQIQILGLNEGCNYDVVTDTQQLPESKSDQYSYRNNSDIGFERLIDGKKVSLELGTNSSSSSLSGIPQLPEDSKDILCASLPADNGYGSEVHGHSEQSTETSNAESGEYDIYSVTIDRNKSKGEIKHEVLEDTSNDYQLNRSEEQLEGMSDRNESLASKDSSNLIKEETNKKKEEHNQDIIKDDKILLHDQLQGFPDKTSKDQNKDLNELENASKSLETTHKKNIPGSTSKDSKDTSCEEEKNKSHEKDRRLKKYKKKRSDSDIPKTNPKLDTPVVLCQAKESDEEDNAGSRAEIFCVSSSPPRSEVNVPETKAGSNSEPSTTVTSQVEAGPSTSKADVPENKAFWLIFSGEYTKAMNKDWHSGHFCCWQCDESLTGQRYVLRDEHPYCIKCYESIFANGCEECNKTIGIDSKDLSYKDKHWHEACFLCNKCRVSLVDKQFGSKLEKIFCGNCYDTQFASRCDGCGQIFKAGTKKMEYKTRQWHEPCFACCVCKSPIGTKSFIPREQEIYCATCYEEKFATRCTKCNKVITSGGVTYKNEPWHRECFTCTNCSASLAGQRFTSRDEKPYCAECFGELFAKRCTSCSKPITGIGGTRFISFEDRHWHNDCFICASCKTSLVGRGFITDADDIICPDCAKQKLM